MIGIYVWSSIYYGPQAIVYHSKMDQIEYNKHTAGIKAIYSFISIKYGVHVVIHIVECKR